MSLAIDGAFSAKVRDASRDGRNPVNEQTTREWGVCLGLLQDLSAFYFDIAPQFGLRERFGREILSALSGKQAGGEEQ